MKSFCCFLLCAGCAYAQLVSSNQAIPVTTKPPVVFVNGYQSNCASSTFDNTFGTADQTLQRNGEVSIFFNNCSVAGKPSIEDLGTAFGTFLNTLKFVGGAPVKQVDVVAHSMGGLIVRSYLEGKQNADATFTPPAVVPIRKLVFLATPHFGTSVAQLTSSPDIQTQELTPGSRFLYDLATWNQGTDDIRAVDALGVVGDAGTGVTTNGLVAFDDSTVTLTSGSLEFAEKGRTRVVHACHITGGLIVTFGLCTANAPGIAEIRSDTQDSARLLISFLNGTDDWKSIGQAPADNTYLKANLGVLAAWKDPSDKFRVLQAASYVDASGKTQPMTVANQFFAFKDLVPAKSQVITLQSGALTLSGRGDLQPGDTQVFTYKDGTSISRIFPSASAVYPLLLAPGMFVSIYGGQLADSTAAASGLPFPTQLGSTQVLLGGTPLPLQIVTAGQINAVLPTGLSGLLPLTVKNSAGTRTVNILIAPSLPTLFTSDGSGTGNVAALNALTGTIVSPSNPLKAGDYVSLYLTGLGDTTTKGGLDYSNLTPSVFVGGVACPVTYAGRAPGFVGLDQINCQIPSGLQPGSAVSVVVTSGGRVGNQGTIALQ